MNYCLIQKSMYTITRWDVKSVSLICWRPGAIINSVIEEDINLL